MGVTAAWEDKGSRAGGATPEDDVAGGVESTEAILVAVAVAVAVAAGGGGRFVEPPANKRASWATESVGRCSGSACEDVGSGCTRAALWGWS